MKRTTMSFQNRAFFRDWLEEQTNNEGIWVVFSKKGGAPSLKHSEALEEAICFGWIDGIIKKIDEFYYQVYFAPRKDKSVWSEKNKVLYLELEKKGLISAKGRVAVQKAKENGCWDKKGRAGITVEMIREFEKLLIHHEHAHSNYTVMSNTIKKTYAGFYFDAKKEDTKIKRLAGIIERLNLNKPPM